MARVEAKTSFCIVLMLPQTCHQQILNKKVSLADPIFGFNVDQPNEHSVFSQVMSPTLFRDDLLPPGLDDDDDFDQWLPKYYFGLDRVDF